MKIEAGSKMWHRIFGWCLITHLPTKSGKVLVDSEFVRVDHYLIGKGWKTYEGKNGGRITSICMDLEELHPKEIKDKAQALLSVGLKQFKVKNGILHRVT